MSSLIQTLILHKIYELYPNNLILIIAQALPNAIQTIIIDYIDNFCTSHSVQTVFKIIPYIYKQNFTNNNNNLTLHLDTKICKICYDKCNICHIFSKVTYLCTAPFCTNIYCIKCISNSNKYYCLVCANKHDTSSNDENEINNYNYHYDSDEYYQ